MAKSRNQKQKLLQLAKIFYEQTDENHGLKISEIIRKLGDLEINADRKTLYLDFEELTNFGMEILCYQKSRSFYYYLSSRTFELAELKLLVDCVQASKFISERKSRELIKKIESLTNTYQAKQLNRQVLLSGRIKSMNESIFYNVDSINNAINENKQILFKYCKWNLKKEHELRRGGMLYKISPWTLIWDDEYYYLLGYDDTNGIMKHFRVDKMKEIMISDIDRTGKEAYDEISTPKLSKSTFGMFSGETKNVTLLCENECIGVIIDRFGKDIPIIKKDEDHFETHVNVSISKLFLGWVVGIGGIKITAPESVVALMKEEITKLNEQYFQ